MKTQQSNKPTEVTRTVGNDRQATYQTGWDRVDALGDEDMTPISALSCRMRS